MGNYSKLFLQKGNSFHLYDNFYIKHPTIGEIADLNEVDSTYGDYVSTLISTSLDMADMLFMEYGIWYEDIKDEFTFLIERSVTEEHVFVYKNVDGVKGIPEHTICVDKMLSDALNFFIGTTGKYVVYKEDDEPCLINATEVQKGVFEYNEKCFKLLRPNYEIIRDFLSAINWRKNVDHDVIHCPTKKGKKYILEHEYKRRIDDARKHNTSSVTIDSITSSLVAKGVGYDVLWTMPIYMIHNLYYRYVQFDGWEGTRLALYSGNLDTKKHPIDWEKVNWSKIID